MSYIPRIASELTYITLDPLESSTLREVRQVPRNECIGTDNYLVK